jgi:hypothetical protein
MSTSAVRNNIIALARHNPKAALARTKNLTDPWYRSQALAWVAWLTPDDVAFRPIIAEGIRVAQGADDPYQRVGAIAWPLRALIERRMEKQAITVVKVALNSVSQIENPVSRADALFLLFQAAHPLGGQATKQLAAALVSGCSATEGWKGQHILRDTALMLASTDIAVANKLVASMREGRERRQAERLIAEGQFMQPRGFFWQNPKGPIEP